MMKQACMLIVLSFLFSSSVFAYCFDTTANSIIVSSNITCSNANESYDANISVLTYIDGFGVVRPYVLTFVNYNLSVNFTKNNVYVDGNLVMDDTSHIFDDYFTTAIIPVLNVSVPLLWSVTGDNLTTRNLSVNFTTTMSITNITDFRISNSSIASVFSFDLPNTTGWVRDYSTNMFNLNESDSSPVWKTSNCLNGGCYHFDSDNKYLHGDFVDVGRMKEWTITLWIRPTYLGDSAIIFSYGGYYNDSLYETNIYGVFCNMLDDGGVYVNYWEQGNNNSLNSTELLGARVEFGSWNMISVSYDNRTKNLSYYVNGSLKDSTIVLNSILQGYNGTFFGGRYAYYNIHYCPSGGCNEQTIYSPFLGDMDSIKVFNKTLTGEQIKILYEQEMVNTSWTTITDDMTGCGEVWSAAVTPNNLLVDGSTKYSNDITIQCILDISTVRYPVKKKVDFQEDNFFIWIIIVLIFKVGYLFYPHKKGRRARVGSDNR